jgi:hypothetical protein
LATADLGENPHEICQLFSISTLGDHLRQLSHLPWDGRPSPEGCVFQPPGAGYSTSARPAIRSPGPCCSCRAAIPSARTPSGGKSSRCGRTARGFASSRTHVA